jgi:hypothetical protein
LTSGTQILPLLQRRYSKGVDELGISVARSGTAALHAKLEASGGEMPCGKGASISLLSQTD